MQFIGGLIAGIPEPELLHRKDPGLFVPRHTLPRQKSDAMNSLALRVSNDSNGWTVLLVLPAAPGIFSSQKADL